MPIGLPAIVSKARRNSRQPSDAGDDLAAFAARRSASTTTGAAGADEATVRRPAHASSAAAAAAAADETAFDPSFSGANGTLLPSGSLLHPGSALHGASQKAQQVAMRSPSGSTPGSPAPDAAALAFKLGPPGVVAGAAGSPPQGHGHGTRASRGNSNAGSVASSTGDRPGDGSLTFESLDLASLGNNDIVLAEPHRQQPSTASVAGGSAVGGTAAGAGGAVAAAGTDTAPSATAASSVPSAVNGGGAGGTTPAAGRRSHAASTAGDPPVPSTPLNTATPLVASPGTIQNQGPSISKSAPGGLLASFTGKDGQQTQPRPDLVNDGSSASLMTPSKSAAAATSSPSKLRQTLTRNKSNNAFSHGIAGALAASAMTGMGVGLSKDAIVSSPQSTLLSPPGTANSGKRPSFTRTASGSNLSAHMHSHAHARDQSSATFIDHGTGSDNEDAVFAHERQRSLSARRPGRHHNDYADDELSSDDHKHALGPYSKNSSNASLEPSVFSDSAAEPATHAGGRRGSAVSWQEAVASAHSKIAASTQALVTPAGALIAQGSSNSTSPDYTNSSGLRPPGEAGAVAASAPTTTTTGTGDLLSAPGVLSKAERRVSSEATALASPRSPGVDLARLPSAAGAAGVAAALAVAPVAALGAVATANASSAAGTYSNDTQDGSGGNLDVSAVLGARTPGTPIPKPVLTPSGVGAVGGLSPSGMGERLTLEDEAAALRRRHHQQHQQHGGDPSEVLPSQAAHVSAGAGAGGVGMSQQESYFSGSMPPLVTGYAVASTKRNNAFHQLFSNVPEDDFLIEDYACALAREILVQGRLYVSENHLAFNANIFGWVTNVVIPFADIVSIEKRMTAFVIPNAIQISTLHAKHTFTSFLSRDTAYDLIANIWRLSHPNFTSNFDAMPDFSDDESVTGQAPISEKGAGDDSQGQIRKNAKRHKLKEKLQRGSKNGPGAGAGGAGGPGPRPQTGGENGVEKDGEISAAANGANGGAAGGGGGGGGASGAIASRAGSGDSSGTGAGAGSGGSAGKQKAKKAPHRATTCSCERSKEHYPTVVLDAKYPAVPEKMYNMLFTSGFMKDFWQVNQKLMDLQMSDWCPDPSHKNMLSRSMSYIKPLTGSFGPKQTKCQITDENLHVDFDDYVSTLTTTRTPDVPSGNSFAVKTRTCFTWAGGNTTRIYEVERACSKFIFFAAPKKGIIDKASIDGQRQYYKDLDEAIHAYLREHASEFKEEGDDEIVEDDEAGVDANGGANAEQKGAKGGVGADADASKKSGSAGAGHGGGGGGGAGADGGIAGSGGSKESGTGTTGNSGAGGATGSGGGGGGGGGMVGALQPYLDMVTNGISDLLGMGMDAISGASPSMLILGSVVVVLLLSNLWALTLREPPAGYRYRNQEMERGGYGRQQGQQGHPQQQQQGYYGQGQGYGQGYGYGYGYGPGPGQGQGGGPGGGGENPSDALAAALREVLKEHFGPATPGSSSPPGSGAAAPPPPTLADAKAMAKDAAASAAAATASGGPSGGGGVAAQVDEIEKLLALINDAESKIARLKGDLPLRGGGGGGAR
ncbi:hypothetical protein OC835_003896 [Tilletia horrida]|nr:hypothetical protein OC835_003896 [Tilletia horrida]